MGNGSPFSGVSLQGGGSPSRVLFTDFKWRPPKWVVRILLECILVSDYTFGFFCTRLNLII